PYGPKLYTHDQFSGMDTKEQFFREMEESKGIIFIVAHADGCNATVVISGGKPITVTARDIATLHLKHSPFIVIRVCEGQATNYARAFLQAGASGVWMNRGKAHPDEIRTEVALFLKHVKQGDTLEDAVRKSMKEDPRSGSASALFTLIPPTLRFTADGQG